MPKKFVPTNVGFLLNHIRLNKKLSAYKIGKDINFSKENIKAIENMRTNPSLHSFIMIFNYLGYEIHIVNKKNKEKFADLHILKD